MSLNEQYTKNMSEGVKALVEGASFDKVTNHVTFKPDSVKMPEGVTTESLKTHVDFINDASAMTEPAVSQIARREFKDNEKLTTVDGTLDFGGFNINSQHHLQQQVGDEYLYGVGTTAIDYIHSEDQTLWLSEQRDANVAEATKLFAK